MTLTLTDFFCGAGGSSTGATQVPGVTAARFGLRDIPGLGACAEALGIETNPHAAHTALGDANLALAVYDALMVGAA